MAGPANRCLEDFVEAPTKKPEEQERSYWILSIRLTYLLDANADTVRGASPVTVKARRAGTALPIT
jgi:hypothetical protein